MAAGNGVAAAPATANGKVWRRPKDGKEFVATLVGGYKDTRAAIVQQLWTRYAIRVVNHFGNEKRKDLNSIHILAHVEIVIILADDIEDPVLQRVLKCCRAGGQLNIGIDRKRPQAWDSIFASEGFANPPRFRDVDHISMAKLEQERLKELAEIEDTRTAYIDPKIEKAGATLADVIAKAPPAKPAAPPPVPAPEKKGNLKPGQTVEPRSPFGAMLRQIRLDNGYSQGILAKKLDVNQAQVSTWERGDCIPSFELYARLRSVLPGLPATVDGMRHSSKVIEATVTTKEPPRKTAADVFGPKQTPLALPPPPAPVPRTETVVPVVTAPLPPPPPARVEPPPSPVPAPAPTGEAVTVQLRSGGTLTLRVTVNLFALKGEDRAFVFELIDKIHEYEAKP